MDPVLRERVAQVLHDTYEEGTYAWDQLLVDSAEPEVRLYAQEIRDDFLDLAEVLWLAGFIKEDA